MVAVFPRLISAALLAACLAAIPDSGRAQTNAPSLRVVSLAPNLTELVFALGLGDGLVGRSSACDYPPDCTRLPVVGGFGRPNMEALEKLKPDIVLATDLEKPGLFDRLNSMGVQTLLLPCESWDGLMQAGIRISEALQRREAGERFVREMSVRRNELQKRVELFFAGRPRPRVYVEVWSDPITTAGRATFLSDMIQLAGGENIAAVMKPKYVYVSSEWVIDQDPDAILLAYMLPSASAVAALVKRPGWDTMRAVRRNAICAAIQPDLLLRPGPRMIDGAEAFADWLMKRQVVSGQKSEVAEPSGKEAK